MIFKQLSKIVTITAHLALAACQTIDTSQNWPLDLPDRQFFVDNYKKKRNLSEVSSQTVEAHLIWIKRFYQGTILYPNGWNDATKMFLETASSEQQKKALQERMHELGKHIACEWAQDNEIRKINSANVAVWGSALRHAAAINDHNAYISKVEKDVADLISGNIQRSEIAFERYYPDEDYDNF